MISMHLEKDITTPRPSTTILEDYRLLFKDWRSRRQPENQLKCSPYFGAFFILSRQILRPAFQSLIGILKASRIFVLLSTEYAGLLAGVGYSAVGIAFTLQLLAVSSLIAIAKS